MSWNMYGRDDRRGEYCSGMFVIADRGSLKSALWVGGLTASGDYISSFWRLVRVAMLMFTSMTLAVLITVSGRCSWN